MFSSEEILSSRLVNEIHVASGHFCPTMFFAFYITSRDCCLTASLQ